MLFVLILALFIQQTPASVFDYYYNFWYAPAGELCENCPLTPTHGNWWGTCAAFSPPSGIPALGMNATTTTSPGTFNATAYWGCLGFWTGQYELITCTTCYPYYATSGPAPSIRNVCWQIVNQSQCIGLKSPAPPSPSAPKPKKKGGNRWVEEHYKKESSSESYDRVERGGNGGDSSSDSSSVEGDALWTARVPENLRTYFSTSQAAAIPQPVSTSPIVYFLMALTFGVVIGVGSYVAKKSQKRSEYVPIKESADNDSLLFS